MQDQHGTAEPGAGEQGFRAVLTPHRSLSPAGFLILMGTVASVSFVTGMVFLLKGAWPVLLFCGLDVVLIYVAFRLNYRAGRMAELVELSGEALSVTRVHASGREETFAFNPYWVRVRLDELPGGGTALKLASHGRELAFGRFLTDEERRDLADALAHALREANAAPGS